MLGLLALLLGAGRGLEAAPPSDEAPARVKKALVADAADLRRVARTGDESGLERTADADWETAFGWDPDDEATRKRLRWIRREGVWVRDEASRALLQGTPDAKPQNRPAYLVRRSAEFLAPSAARHRELAAWCRAQGLGAEAEAQLRLALERDPSDLWSHLCLGEAFDPEEGWIPEDLRARRVANDQAAAGVRRLLALRSEPTRQEGDSTLAQAIGAPMTSWRLREWRIETDLPDEAASLALSTVDLGARWFRGRFGLEIGAPVLPGEGVFVVLSTPERYAAALEAEPSFRKAERTFGRGLSSLPAPHVAGRPWVVVIERPDGYTAADACLHYAMHFLFQARFQVEAQEAWLYEGLAAYGTLRLMGTQGTWCVRLEETSAATADRAPDPGDWAEEISGIVSKGTDEPLRRLVGASLNELDGPMLIQSWSLLRFLLEQHGEEMVALLEARRAGRSTEAALLSATGLRLDDLDELWRRHVRAILGE